MIDSIRDKYRDNFKCNGHRVNTGYYGAQGEETNPKAFTTFYFEL